MKAKKSHKKNKPVPKTKWIAGIVILAGLATLLAYGLSGPNSKKTEPSAWPATMSTASAADVSAGTAGGTTLAAMQRAASENKYLFLFVHEGNNDSTLTVRKEFEAVLGKLGDQAQWTTMDRSDPAQKNFVAKYGLDRSAMPMVLAVAPNGAITGGFQAAEATEERLRDAIASTGLQQCLKALQDRRLVMVCLQNTSTQGNDEAMRGVNDFKATSQYASITDIVKVDPSDAKETKLLAQLKADPQTKTATTAFLAPPGVLVAKVEGATTKDALLASLQQATASKCGPGAGAGCCPPPKK